MSPLSLSAPSTQPSPSQTSRKGVRFGQGAEKTHEKAQAAQEASETAPPESVKDSVEIGKEPAQKPDSKPAPESLSIFDRISKFFEYLKKAFNVLFGGKNQVPGDAAKSESELQWKGLKPFLKPIFDEDGFSELPKEKAELQKQLANLGEKAQKDLKTNDMLKHLKIKHELIAASELKDQYKVFLKETATNEGRRQFLKDQLEQPNPKVLERFNQRLQQAGGEVLSEDEFKDFLWEQPEAAPGLYKYASVIPESKVLSRTQRMKQALSPTAIKRAFSGTPQKTEEAPEPENA